MTGGQCGPGRAEATSQLLHLSDLRLSRPATGLSFLICEMTALMCPSLVPASTVLGSSPQVPPGVFCRSNPDTFPLVWLGRPLIQPSHPTEGSLRP